MEELTRPLLGGTWARGREARIAGIDMIGVDLLGIGGDIRTRLLPIEGEILDLRGGHLEDRLGEDPQEGVINDKDQIPLLLVS